MSTHDSDHQWEHYLANMGGYSASIVYDESLASALERTEHKTALSLKIQYSNKRHDGLPLQQEGERLSDIDAKVHAALDKARAIYLGRITTNGVRWVFTLVPDNPDELGATLRALVETAGFEVDVLTRPDPEHEVYWQDLYPTQDDRQVM